MKKISLVINLLLLIALLSLGAYAYFNDHETANVTMTAASLKLGEVTVVPANLGGNIKPGDSGSFVVNVKNVGTIPGNYTVQIKNNPDYLVFESLKATGQVEANQTVPVTFKWSIPAETDLGTGGQEIKLDISVDLEQIH